MGTKGAVIITETSLNKKHYNNNLKYKEKNQINLKLKLKQSKLYKPINYIPYIFN